MRAIWSGIAVLLLLMLSVPIFAEAVDGQTTDTSPLGIQTTALIAALGTLGEQVTSLQGDISSLRGALSEPSDVGTDTSLADGMSECLQACRATLASCLSSDTQGSASPLRIMRLTPTPLLARLVPLDACRTEANTCMNRCRPRTPTNVACEDRCAVALGACADAAGTDTAKLADCRMSNQQCLLAACLQVAPDQASMDRVPAAKCADQCRRALGICMDGAKFDQAALDACVASSRVCLERLCVTPATRLPTGEAPAPSPGRDVPSPTDGQGSTEASACETTCTKDFELCREKSAGNPDMLATCDVSYRTCRERCVTDAGVSPTGAAR